MSVRDDFPWMAFVTSNPGRPLQIERNEMAAALDELDRLRRWKTEATEVLKRWDNVAAMIEDAPLGALKSDVVAAGITRLQAASDLIESLRVALEQHGDELSSLEDRLAEANGRVWGPCPICGTCRPNGIPCPVCSAPARTALDAIVSISQERDG